MVQIAMQMLECRISFSPFFLFVFLGLRSFGFSGFLIIIGCLSYKD